MVNNLTDATRGRIQGYIRIYLEAMPDVNNVGVYSRKPRDWHFLINFMSKKTCTSARPADVLYFLDFSDLSNDDGGKGPDVDVVQKFKLHKRHKAAIKKRLLKEKESPL